MGFFSDLKEDLSQAVNELMPGDATQIKAEEEGVSLDEMLKNIDNIKLPEEETAAEGKIEAETETAAEETADGKLAASEEPMPQTPLHQQETVQSQAEIDFRESIQAKTQLRDETLAQEESVAAKAVITAGMTVTGDITTDGSLDLSGKVNGNVDVAGKLIVTGHITGDSKAAEVVAEGAKINGEILSEGYAHIGASTVVVGNITATGATIAGAVKGDVDVHGPVVLESTAIVMGNIKSKSVQINNGAVVEGMCSQCYAEVNPASFFEEYKPDVKQTK